MHSMNMKIVLTYVLNFAGSHKITWLTEDNETQEKERM